ncbi:4542_t:CDS:2 [Funneliformis mosseae]|uniref:4542_t:CDS:1 n=1 Tax=Funneliformis mosseae TaxID=27381 RepID=A0A9N9AE56_FUNMO|nr:4542_t:CDS:2 [Funneliformis mosseae]
MLACISIRKKLTQTYYITETAFQEAQISSSNSYEDHIGTLMR